MQTSYSKLLRAHIADVHSLPAYARTVILNEHRRRKRRDLLRAGGPDEVAMPAFEDQVDLRHDLWRALQRLPLKQKAALILRHYEALEDAEIADILRCSRSNVRTLAARGLATLRADPSIPLRRVRRGRNERRT